jgi:hypothetical protein
VTDESDDIVRAGGEAVLLGAVAGATIMLGPVGGIVAALIGPFASFAARRLEEWLGILRSAGVDEAELAQRLLEDEVLAHLVAEAVRATIESDIRAKRTLLARAVLRALEEDADVNVEARFIRTAGALDTVDVKVLAIIGELTGQEKKRRTVAASVIEKQWEGVAPVIESVFSTLQATGVTEDPAPGAVRSDGSVRLTRYGQVFLGMLMDEGLAAELSAAQDPLD